MRVSSVAAAGMLALAMFPFGVAQQREIQTLSPGLDVERTVEVTRIQSHFDSVLVELSGRDLSSLSAEQRARRTTLMMTLRSYRDRGDFPHNYDFPGRATPYFVDRGTGTLCAVANLLASTGRRDIVDRVARTNNNVFVAELAGDSAFTSWLDAFGLTIAEAARIQVPYTSSTTSQAAALVSIPVTGLSAFTTVWNATRNADGHGRVATVLGVASGMLGLGLGAAALDPQSNVGTFGIASVISGTTSLLVSTTAIVRHHRGVIARRDQERQRRVASATLSPILPVNGLQGAGLAVTLRF